jgi:HSP20 family protein
MDLHEDSEKNLVSATFELPGLKKEDVQLEVHDSLLTVSAEIKSSAEHEENGYAVRERRFGRFSRSVRLPRGVKVSDCLGG